MHGPRTNLLEGDVAPHLRRLSLPMVWGLLALSTFGLVDTLYVSRLGTEALAALGFTIPVINLFLGIVWGMMVGTTSVLSRAYGAGDMDRVRRLSTDIIVVASLVILVASVIGHLMTDQIFGAMGVPPAMMPMIRDFMGIWYGGMIFAGLMLISNAIIRADGSTRLQSILMGASAALNIIIDPFLIYGWGPFPEMGLAGAALTLVISYALTAGVSLYVLIWKRGLVCRPLFHKGMFRSWGQLLHVSGPAVFSNMIAPLSNGIGTRIAAGIHTEAVAALGVALRIEGMAILIFFALGTGLAIFTGQNFGAGNYGRVREALNKAAEYAFIWSLAMMALLWGFSDTIPVWFEKNPAVVHYTAEYLRIVPITYGPLGLLFLSAASLNAMGKPLPATVLMLLRAFVLYVPLTYFGAKLMGFEGILFALALTNVSVGVASHLWNKKIIP